MPCIIVRRGDFQTYDLLYKAYSHRLPVIWDRRKRPDITGAEKTTADTSDVERRSSPLPASWAALGFLVVERYP